MIRSSCQLSVVSCQHEKVLCLIILLTVFISGCINRGVKNIDAKGTTIICFGDSITWGYGVEPDESFPVLLKEMLDRPVLNMGIDGDTTIEAMKRLETDVLERDPFLVIIEFSGNDFLRKIPKEESFNNIRQMVEKIQARGAMVAIVDISAGIFLGEYRAALRRLSREKRTIFIPHILSGIITNSKLKSDFFHPNAEGYKLVAQRIHRAILPYLERNAKYR